MSNKSEYYPIVPAKWVKPHMLMPLFGLSMEAARKKRERGVWLEGKHWRVAPDGTYVYNWQAIQNWYGGQL